MLIIGRVLYGADELVAEFVRRRIAHIGEAGFRNARTGTIEATALGVVIGGELVGGAVFHNYRGFDVEMSAAFDTPRWCLPETLRRLFAYPFLDLGCARMTTITAADDTRTRRIDEGLGFVLEGIHPRGLDGVRDAVSYGMLREDCRWIKLRRQQNESGSKT